MRFRVTAKDLTMFIIFCIFLLILSSLAVLNVSSLLNSAEFFGLNFFAGFLPPYLVPTLVLFISVIVAVFMSVKSYIFEREKGSKGLGFDFKEKDEKGYSRWLTAKEMKNAPGIVKVPIKAETADGAGIVVINDGKTMYVDNEHHHTLVVGQTGSGKTTALVDPLIYSLSKKGESMVLTDPKGEIYRNHSEMLRAKGYNIIVLNFRNPELGNSWNPLTLPYRLYKEGNTDKATELLDDVALNILYDPENKNDPFWEKSAADYFSGLALGLFEDAKEEQINLNSINYMATVGEEAYAAGNYIKEYFTLKGEQSNAYVFASNTINAPQDTKGSILSVFRQKIRLFASREQLSEMLSYSNFNMKDIGNEKTAVFMIIHDEKTTYHALATIFIKQCYETLIDVAQHETNGRLKYRTNFILDEFANMPPLKDVTTMVTAARSRSIRFTFIIQNFAQLNDVYGKENAETIRSNCGNLIYLLTTEYAALEEISKLCGEVKSKEKDKTASTPLITVSDLQKLQMNEVIILHSRLNPFRTKLKPSYEIDWGTSGFGKGELAAREKRPVELFDLRDFVKVKKRNKLYEALDGGFNKKEDEKSNLAESTNASSSMNSFMPNFDFNDKAISIDEDNDSKNDDLSFNSSFTSQNSVNSFNPMNPMNTTSSNGLMNSMNSLNEDQSRGDAPVFESLFNSDEKLEDMGDIESESLNKGDDNKHDYDILDNKDNNLDKTNFDIDSIVKRIDAKIAELEEKEKNESSNVNNLFTPETDNKLVTDDLIKSDANDDYDKLDNTIVERFDDFMKEDDDNSNTEPVINVDNDSVVVSDVTDDEYLDDFFDSDN